MRLLLDMGLPRRSAADLSSTGFDAVHVGTVGLHDRPDSEILELALRQDRVVVTLDRDFARLLALQGASRPSVIHLRLDGLSRERATRVILAVVHQVEDDLDRGSIVTVSTNGIRVRRLPIR